MQSTTTIQPSTPPKDPVIAALLSFFILGGAGQLYVGQQKKGIILIVVAALAWCLTVGTLGWIIHILGAYDAYVIANKLKNGQSVGDMEWFWQAGTTTA